MPQLFDDVAARRTLWGPGSESARASCEAYFRTLCPQGHCTSIRSFIEDWLTLEDDKRNAPQVAHLAQIPTEAAALLVKYGRDYRPYVWKKEPSCSVEPGQCFKNAHALINSSAHQHAPRGAEPELAYVEGLVLGATVSPMLHAWNARGSESRVAIDVTHSAGCRWNRYFGVALTPGEYRELQERLGYGSGVVISLFHARDFDKTKIHLTELIERRAVHTTEAA